LAADGIQNVIHVLEELEDDKLTDLDFIELNACSGGCVGGVFTAENGYVARARIKRLRKYMPMSCNRAEDAGDPVALQWSRPLKENPALRLADNVEDAMRLMQKAEQVFTALPKLDCGACGAPSCHALAQDVALGLAQETDCIFLMRRQIQEIATRLAGMEGFVPPSNEKGEN
jgi:hypothetical protein